MSLRLRPLTLAALSAALLCGYATYPSSTLIDWKYYGTYTGKHPYDLGTGRPLIAEYTRTLPSGLPALPADLMTKVRYTLPEGRDIRQNAQGLIPDTDDKSNVVFKEDAEVWVTFLSEGAGYLNSVGFFTYDPASPPRTPQEVGEKIFFANASMSTPLDAAGTTYQNTVYLGRFPQGKALGFMIVSDGFKSNARSYLGTKVNGVKENADRKWIFYTLRHLNPEAASAQNLNAHTVVLRDLSGAAEGYQRLVVGFEDINREHGGDHDFNDVVLAVHVTPGRSIANLETLQPLVTAIDPDTDGDGVKDVLDEFPNDPNRAFSRYYPDRNTYGTLAYEDQWPKRGDFDLNDVVMRYRTREIMNAQRQVVALELDYRMDARGGQIDTGFAVNFPGVAASSVKAATLAVNGGAAAPMAVETGQTEASFVIMPSSIAAMPAGSGACWYANTQNDCPATGQVSYRATVDLNAPMASTAFSSPYNPYIFHRNRRGVEVHLPGRQPSPLADRTLFRTQDDKSTLGSTTTYMDAQRRPWALDIPVNWQHPQETSDIGWAYPRVVDWAVSAGASWRDWYTAPVSRHLYTPR